MFKAGAIGRLLAEIPTQKNYAPAWKPTQFISNDITRAIRAPIVHNHQFPIYRRIFDGTLDLIKKQTQPLMLVEHGNDDRNQRSLRGPLFSRFQTHVLARLCAMWRLVITRHDRSRERNILSSHSRQIVKAGNFSDTR